MASSTRSWKVALLLAALGGGVAHAQAPDDGARRTVRAARVAAPLAIDGRLDEALYETVAPMSGFLQYEPQFGGEPSEQTDIWVAFDDANVYVGVRAWESAPERMVANEMRRDSFNIFQNENVAFVFDTFGDRRNGVEFAITPIGGRIDGQLTNEGNYNGDWNPVWDFAVGRFDGGWTAEAAIPFKSLRYAPGAQQDWGFQVRRFIRWRNEMSYLTPPPAGLGQAGLFRVSAAATLTGIEAPPPSRNLEVKPFVIGDLSTDLAAAPAVRNDPGGDAGLDVKYGITPNLTADLTVNTDFAQVEADERQVNLTRFSLFFPEKREFFLENAGLFQFGGGGGTNDTPVMFYSRRIGLDQGREVPILAGGRVTGRVGAFGVGALSIQTDEVADRGVESTRFSVLRLQRDVLQRSTVGAIYARRSVSLTDSGAHQTYGVDARLGLGDNLTVNTYWAQTDTPGAGPDDTSNRMLVEYDSDRYGVTVNHLMIGTDFAPEVGFLTRADILREYVALRYSPRPASIAAIRQFSWQGSVQYIEDRAGQPETRRHELEFVTTLENSDVLTAVYGDFYQYLDAPFEISNGVVLPVAEYAYGTGSLSYAFGDQRPVSGTVSLERGGFWSGNRTTMGVSGARITFGPQLAVEPSLSWNRVTLPEGDFTTTVTGSRVTYTLTPRMFVSGLVQYGSRDGAVGSNVRFRWEYEPGSELFVVYNESRDTLQPGFPDLQDRALIIKFNRLLRF
jgi:hypothetical protein